MLKHKDIYAHLEEPQTQVLSVRPLHDHDLHTWVVVIRIPEGMLRSMLWQNGAETYGKLKDALFQMFLTRWRQANPLQTLLKKRA